MSDLRDLLAPDLISALEEMVDQRVAQPSQGGRTALSPSG